MNSSDMVPLTTDPTYTTATVAEISNTRPLTSLPTHADTTVIQVVTTAVPTSPDSAVVAVVIVLILVTVAALGFLLYRYLCHNKGDYRTTGELAPGEDPDEEYNNQAASEKKEYFI
ncbi:cell adhesion molecule 2-like isoform X1 [Xiphias gladius]|uniref:cell adhesion molecule 2-like isoform X1 n=1 Tax=Xiphias gladius TaxID=8245 RepID=UPI001A99AC96|nr:cell adhesion molecule 2-like isoform X1 [Xiphias gladius]XP_040007765.1 cell adhesion molecule 2-like isoform X1 [Xiphias gladius]